MPPSETQPSGKGLASYFPSIEKKYGRPIAEWQALIREQPGKKHMELVAWLKEAHARVRYEWSGVMDATPDAILVISPVHTVPGLHVASCFSGYGFGIGPGAGQLMADLITGDAPASMPRFSTSAVCARATARLSPDSVSRGTCAR